MKSVVLLTVLVLLGGMVLAGGAAAEDKVLKFPVKHALSSKLAKEKMLDDIRIYMHGQGNPGAARTFREYKSNKRSNGLNDQDTCDKAFISALISLQQRADREGGNAVIGIFSEANNKKTKSADTYSCLRGRTVSQVVLRGTVVRLN